MKLKLKVLGTTACLGMLLSVTVASALGPAEEGRRVYLRENCYGCHGGRAGGGMGPQFRSDRPDAGDVGEVVRKGDGGGMPAYPHLTAQDISNLSAYFRTLRTKAEPTFTHWWEAVPTR
jgi:cytochrome c551